MINKDTTYLFYSNISKFNKNAYKKYYNMLPPSRKMHVDRLVYEADRARSVFSYGLLYEALKRFDIDITAYSFFQNENGKPYLDKCPVKFSMSHSGKYVAVSFSLNESGCDIQEIVKKSYNSLLPIMMCDEELKYHSKLDSKEKKRNLFRVWSKKESYLKLLGVGLSKSMKSFNASKPSDDSDIYSVSLANKYFISCSYTTKNLNVPLEIKF